MRRGNPAAVQNVLDFDFLDAPPSRHRAVSAPCTCLRRSRLSACRATCALWQRMTIGFPWWKWHLDSVPAQCIQAVRVRLCEVAWVTPTDARLPPLTAACVTSLAAGE